jgi:hypothetical protein
MANLTLNSDFSVKIGIESILSLEKVGTGWMLDNVLFDNSIGMFNW